MSITDQVKAGHAQRAHEQNIPDETNRQWVVYGVAVVTAKDRREATDKAKAGQLTEAWEPLDDVGGFYEPEPHNFDDGQGYAYTDKPTEVKL